MLGVAAGHGEGHNLPNRQRGPTPWELTQPSLDLIRGYGVASHPRHTVAALLFGLLDGSPCRPSAMRGSHVPPGYRGAILTLAPTGLLAATRFALRHLQHPLCPAVRSGRRVAYASPFIILSHSGSERAFLYKVLSYLKLHYKLVQVYKVVVLDIFFLLEERS